ncbi:MAG: helix-turn-helix domain-containing protein [Methanomassiliicoccaceae archaeon]|nr:helix-turn-helix domain-containing protein [Methanomassiliicoccaceae archaeon]
MEQHSDPYFLSDNEIISRIGKRIRTARLNMNITREELQEITGVNKKTIGDAESGKNITMLTFIALIRGVGMLDRLNELLREEGVSPVMLAKMRGKEPQRATGKR